MWFLVNSHEVELFDLCIEIVIEIEVKVEVKVKNDVRDVAARG